MKNIPLSICISTSRLHSLSLSTGRHSPVPISFSPTVHSAIPWSSWPGLCLGNQCTIVHYPNRSNNGNTLSDIEALRLDFGILGTSLKHYGHEKKDQ